MNNSFKINVFESLLIILIFLIINVFFNVIFDILIKKYHDFTPYLYPLNYFLPYLILVFGLVFIWFPLKKESLQLKSRRISCKNIMFSIVLFLYCWVITKLIIEILPNEDSILFIYFDELFGTEVQQNVQNYLTEMRNILQKIYLYLEKYPVSGCITIGIIAPIVEEVLFRGIILQGFLNYGYKKVNSLLLSSFIFSVPHVTPWQMVGAFFLGITIGWIFLHSQSLVLVIFLHLVNNLGLCLFHLLLNLLVFLLCFFLPSIEVINVINHV